jgi:ATP phosphoribosyltransferase
MSSTHPRPRVAIPSKGRLRDDCLALLKAAGYSTSMFHGAGARANVDGLECIEMRPRDAAAALAAGSLDAAFLATDIVREHGLAECPRLPLGFARTDLVVASRADDGRESVDDLRGCVVATHLPASTEAFFAERAVAVTVVAMGGSLEGVCAAGLADAIVDLRETGTSLVTNGLRALEVIVPCQAEFVRRTAADVAAGSTTDADRAADREAATLLDDLVLRLEAVLDARRHRYVMLHIPRDRVDDLRQVFPGLASPTVLPLAARDDLVAVHFVVTQKDLWRRLGDLRALGATGIVALIPEALLT